MNRGVTVSFEGIEGSGKTTQAEFLYKDLTKAGIASIFTREPGGTEVGEKIRKVLLDPEEKITAWTELLLYLAARAQLVEEIVIPALKEKKVVILDRYTDSTFAYQAAGRNLPYRQVSVFNKIITRSLKPDLTILVDIEPSAGLKRLKKSRDRMELENGDYHKRVREGYLQLAKKAKKRIKLIDGTLAKDTIHKRVKELVYPFLRNKGYRL